METQHKALHPNEIKSENYNKLKQPHLLYTKTLREIRELKIKLFGTQVNTNKFKKQGVNPAKLNNPRLFSTCAANIESIIFKIG
jgi:hypothetical protein